MPGARPWQRGSGKWQVSTAGGTYPKWAPDGKELFFLNPAGEMMAASDSVIRIRTDTGYAGEVCFRRGSVAAAQTAGGPQYDVARDGRFLINTVLDAARAPPITLIQNWNPDAKK